MRPLVTVFTPTFNRAHALPNLYESLKRQTDQDFEWLVIDDGSTDDSAALLRGMSAGDQGFELRFHTVPNGGKPRAITMASRMARGEFLLIVDSDDYLVDEAIELVRSWIPPALSEPRCVGVGAIRWVDTQQAPPRIPVPRGESFVRCTNLDRMKSGILGEMNEAYRVDVLKQYPFRVWPGENFVPEQVVLDQMALDGWYLHWYDRTICIGGYLQDGLTKGSGLLEVDNPMGYAMLANHKLKYLHGLEGVRAAIQHIALSVVGRNPSYILESNRPWLTALMLPIGLVWSIRRHKQFGNRVKKARSIT